MSHSEQLPAKVLEVQLVLPVEPGLPFLGPLQAFLFANNRIGSEHTRRAYERHIRMFFQVLGLEAVDQVGLGHMAAFRQVVMETELAPGSKAQALSAVRSFLEWSLDMSSGSIPNVPARSIQRILSVPDALVLAEYDVFDDDEMARLLNAAEASSPRDLALVQVLGGAGLRVEEVEALEPRDLKFDITFYLHVREGKGGKEREVPASEDVAQAVMRYLAFSGRSTSTPGPLFLREDRAAGKGEPQRLSDRGIRFVVAGLARKAAITVDKRVCPHALRHTFAHEFYKRCQDVILLMKVMGHAKMETSKRYADHHQLLELRKYLPTWRGAGGAQAV